MLNFIILAFCSIFTNILSTESENPFDKCTILLGEELKDFPIGSSLPISSYLLESCVCTKREIVTCNITDFDASGICTLTYPSIPVINRVVYVKEFPTICVCESEKQIECATTFYRSVSGKQHIRGETCIYNKTEYGSGNLLPVSSENIKSCLCVEQDTVICTLTGPIVDEKCTLSDGLSITVGNPVYLLHEFDFPCICSQTNNIECTMIGKEIHPILQSRNLQANCEKCTFETIEYQVGAELPIKSQNLNLCVCVRNEIFSCTLYGVGKEEMCTVNSNDFSIGSSVSGLSEIPFKCNCVLTNTIECIISNIEIHSRTQTAANIEINSRTETAESRQLQARGEKCTFETIEYQVGAGLPIKSQNLNMCVCVRNEIFSCTLYGLGKEGMCTVNGNDFPIGSSISGLSEIPFQCNCVLKNTIECKISNIEIHSRTLTKGEKSIYLHRDPDESALCLWNGTVYKGSIAIPNKSKYDCYCIRTNMMLCNLPGPSLPDDQKTFCKLNNVEYQIGGQLPVFSEEQTACLCVEYQTIECDLRPVPQKRSNDLHNLKTCKAKCLWNGKVYTKQDNFMPNDRNYKCFCIQNNEMLCEIPVVPSTPNDICVVNDRKYHLGGELPPFSSDQTLCICVEFNLIDCMLRPIDKGNLKGRLQDEPQDSNAQCLWNGTIYKFGISMPNDKNFECQCIRNDEMQCQIPGPPLVEGENPTCTMNDQKYQVGGQPYIFSLDQITCTCMSYNVIECYLKPVANEASSSIPAETTSESFPSEASSSIPEETTSEGIPTSAPEEQKSLKRRKTKLGRKLKGKKGKKNKDKHPPAY